MVLLQVVAYRNEILGSIPNTTSHPNTAVFGPQTRKEEEKKEEEQKEGRRRKEEVNEEEKMKD